MDLGCGVIWKDVEPVSEDLEKVACNYGNELDNILVVGIDDDNTVGEYATQAFKVGAQWQKQQMMKEAVNGTFSFGEFADGTPIDAIFVFEKEVKSKYKEGEKVKLLIIKED